MYPILLRLILKQSPAKIYFKLLCSNSNFDYQFNTPRKYAKKFCFITHYNLLDSIGNVKKKLKYYYPNDQLLDGDIIDINPYLFNSRYNTHFYIYYKKNEKILPLIRNKLPNEIEIFSKFPIDYWSKITNFYMPIKEYIKDIIKKEKYIDDITPLKYHNDYCIRLEIFKMIYWIRINTNYIIDANYFCFMSNKLLINGYTNRVFIIKNIL